jgi:hypothetical protein
MDRFGFALRVAWQRSLRRQANGRESEGKIFIGMRVCDVAIEILLIRLLPCYVVQTKSGGRVSGLSKNFRRFFSRRSSPVRAPRKIARRIRGDGVVGP